VSLQIEVAPLTKQKQTQVPHHSSATSDAWTSAGLNNSKQDQ
jgi:hypothetical protein